MKILSYRYIKNPRHIIAFIFFEYYVKWKTRPDTKISYTLYKNFKLIKEVKYGA